MVYKGFVVFSVSYTAVYDPTPEVCDPSYATGSRDFVLPFF